jgi:hypothetical protein
MEVSQRDFNVRFKIDFRIAINLFVRMVKLSPIERYSAS